MIAENTFWVPATPPHDVGRRLLTALTAKFPGEIYSTASATVGNLGKRNFIYGILHGSRDVIDLCRASGRDFVYVDHGYWGKSSSLARLDGNFRLVLNNRMHRCERTLVPLLNSPKSMSLTARRVAKRHAIIVKPSHYVCWYESIPGSFAIKLRSELGGMGYGEVSVIDKQTPISQVMRPDTGIVAGWDSTSILGAIDAGCEGWMLNPHSPWPRPMSHLDDADWLYWRNTVFWHLYARQFTMASIVDPNVRPPIIDADIGVTARISEGGFN